MTALRTLFVSAARWCSSLLRSGPALYVVVFIVVIFNMFAHVHLNLGQPTREGWAFVQLPEGLVAGLRQPPIIAELLLIFFCQIVLDLMVSQQLMKGFRGESTSMRESVKDMKLSSFTWLACVAAMLYAVFIGVALLFYLSAREVWLAYHLYLGLPVLALGVLLYPLFYGLLASAAMISVFPTTGAERRSSFLLFLTPSSLPRLYIFYCGRVLVELALLTVLPFSAIHYLHSRLVAAVAVAVAVLVPVIWIRGASYVFFLEMLKLRSYVRRHFEDYFDALE